MTAKQQRFIDEYLIDLNATQSAVRAGYSANRASEIGYQLLQKNTVSDAIARAMAERSRRTGIAQDRVLQEIARIAFLNPKDVIDLGTLEIRKEASDDDLAAVAYYKHRERSVGDHGMCEEREVRFFDKLKALDMLAKHLGMYNQDLVIEEGQYGVVILPAIDEGLLAD